MANNELLYKELSYKIVGMAYKIDNEIGFGLDEKTYGDMFAKLLIKDHIDYKREYYSPIKLDDELVGKKFLDFLIDGKIIVEFKVGDYKYREACTQLFRYLKASKLRLGIIIRFTKNDESSSI